MLEKYRCGTNLSLTQAICIDSYCVHIMLIYDLQRLPLFIKSNEQYENSEIYELLYGCCSLLFAENNFFVSDTVLSAVIWSTNSR